MIKFYSKKTSFGTWKSGGFMDLAPKEITFKEWLKELFIKREHTAIVFDHWQCPHCFKEYPTKVCIDDEGKIARCIFCGKES